jgi:hypothetical protein
MSYGDVYIETDLRRLKNQGKTKAQAIQIVAGRIKERYPDITKADCVKIATNVSNGKNGGWQNVKRNIKKYRNS